MLRRLLQLYIGLVLYGVSTALFVHANLGADPWDVFHLGVAKQLGISFGTVIILTGAAVLLLWIPIRQMPGLGTVSNVIVLGLAADATLAAFCWASSSVFLAEARICWAFWFASFTFTRHSSSTCS